MLFLCGEPQRGALGCPEALLGFLGGVFVFVFFLIFESDFSDF